MNLMVDRLFLLAQRIAEQTPHFFETKGPGIGDQASLTFMRNLREGAKGLLGKDYSEKRVSDEVSFSIDFYLPDEATAVEIALGLHNPLTEFERDIFKCLLARDAGCRIDRLVLFAKPGGSARQAAPGPRAIAHFVKKSFGIEVEIRELVPL